MSPLAICSATAERPRFLRLIEPRKAVPLAVTAIRVWPYRAEGICRVLVRISSPGGPAQPCKREEARHASGKSAAFPPKAGGAF